jgi:hypothetical protein
MMASSQRLAQAGLPIEEFPRSPTNLTAASQNLYELINTQSIVCYPDSGMRLAVSRAIALETGRGWRIAKEKQAHKIDIVVALAMACYAAVKAQSEPFFDQSWSWVSGPPDKADPHNLDAWRALRTSLYSKPAERTGYGESQHEHFGRASRQHLDHHYGTAL